MILVLYRLGIEFGLILSGIFLGYAIKGGDE